VSATELGLLALSGLVAGLINAVAGGGSLITLPALMLVGIGAAEANATNRIAVMAQSVTAARGFHKAGALPTERVRRELAPTVLGAAIGAWLATRVSDAIMEPLMLAVLVAVGVAMVWRGGTSPAAESQSPSEVNPWLEAAIMGLAGLYGGFLQAGLGLVFLGALVGVIGLDPLRANGVKAALLVGLTVVALAIFAQADMLRWIPGLAVAAGGVLGAAIGVRVALRWASLLRWMALAAVLVSGAVILLR
jgi:uncharacterized membrane protein YfcA